MALKLLTLNIEGDRHLDRVRATIRKHLPDVVCLQEVFEDDCAAFAGLGDYRFRYAISTLKAVRARPEAPPRSWGLGVFARATVRQQTIAYYTEDANIRVFRGPHDPRRVLIATELEHQGEPYRVVTTHFTWSEGGTFAAAQYEDFQRLRQIVAPFRDYVLCGDLNAPRGGRMFAAFMEELGLIDHVPPHVTTTIDARFHYAGDLQLVVDAMFATPHYVLEDVQVLEGISDHKGILATVRRRRE
jgi:endonuclease/exonuclease/phosphatase family metal-dependent hydrolase